MVGPRVELGSNDRYKASFLFIAISSSLQLSSGESHMAKNPLLVAWLLHLASINWLVGSLLIAAPHLQAIRERTSRVEPSGNQIELNGCELASQRSH